MDGQSPSNYQQYKVSIIASLIGTVIFLLILKPVADLCWWALTNVGGNGAEWVLDGLCQNAAIGRPEPGAHLIVVLWVGFTALIAGAIFSTIPGLVRRKAGLPPKSEEPSKWHIYAAFAILILLDLLMACIAVSTITDEGMNLRFRQRMAILAPYLTDADEESFRARWASMRTYEDYLSITSDLKKVADAQEAYWP